MEPPIALQFLYLRTSPQPDLGPHIQVALCSWPPCLKGPYRVSLGNFGVVILFFFLFLLQWGLTVALEV